MARLAILMGELGSTTTLKGVIEGNTKIRPVCDVQATRHYGGYDIELLFDSLTNDESKSRVVLSGAFRGYVTELATQCTQFMYPHVRACRSEAHSTEKSDAEMERSVFGMTDVLQSIKESGNRFQAWTKCF